MSLPNVLVRSQNTGKRIDARTIRRRAAKLLSHLSLTNATVSIVLTDDIFIHELNRTYRHIDKPTDVLSFAMQEGDALAGDTQLLGDIVISIDTAERQAPMLNHSLTDEVTSLLIHGLLHLLGYDHVDKNDEAEMQEQAQTLSALFPSLRHK